MKVLGTGLNGLVGSRVVELLKDKYEFENLSRSTGVDIEDKNSVLNAVKSSDAQIVLHLASKTDVDGCERDKELGEEGEAWRINVKGTKNVVEACQEAGKKLIYFSTDFVFDGENAPKGGYTEENTPNPLNWYARTKYEGERIVNSLKTPWVIVRIAYPYRADFKKSDFFRAILNRLKTGQSVAAVTDHIFSPTFIDDIGIVIDKLIQTESQGIYHAAGGQALTPHDAAILIAKTFELDENLISKTTRKEFFKNRAPRPFQLPMRNDRIAKLGIRTRSFEEGLEEIKKQQKN
jgi:dTDP-4-dehydrorhamnose reductase